MASIKITEIAMPEHYVRGKIISKNVTDLMNVVVAANGHLFSEKDETDWRKLIGKKIKWPFQPCKIAHQ